MIPSLKIMIVNVPADILMIHAGAIGDVICAIHGIRNLSSERTIDICCQKHIFPILHLLPGIQKTIDIHHTSITSMFMTQQNDELKKWLSSYAFILLFSFSQDWKTQLKKYHSVVYRIPPRPPKDQLIHVSDFINNTLISLDLLSDEKLLNNEFILQKKTKCYNNCFQSVCWIHPGSGSSFKNWSIDRFIGLAKKLRQEFHAVKLLLGPSEKKLFHFLDQHRESTDDVIQISQLKTIIDLFDPSHHFIGNDSGISHLAALLGLNVTVIFGPSDARRWKPIGSSVKAIPDVPFCPPCFEFGNRDCSHRNCLDQISVINVLEIVFNRGLNDNEHKKI